VQDGSKKQKLTQLLHKYPAPPIIIFVRERVDTETIANYLNKCGFNAVTLHGSKTQEQREKALKSLKDGVNDILVCTNVAARGLDIEGVNHVINYHAPSNIVDYTHRIGRTGRAGRKGMATTFLTSADEGLLYDLKRFMQDND
jgi:ATP-dependent RNA helicase DDX23/PRP28